MDALSNLKEKLNKMKDERDSLNSTVLNERSSVSEMEAELAQLETEYYSAYSNLKEKEEKLKNLNLMVQESEQAYSKLLGNVNKLLKGLDQETSEISRLFKH